MKKIAFLFIFILFFLNIFSFAEVNFSDYIINIEDFDEFKVVNADVKCEKISDKKCENAILSIDFSYFDKIDSFVVVLQIKEDAFYFCEKQGDFENYKKEKKLNGPYKISVDIYEIARGAKIDVFVDSLVLKEKDQLKEKGKKRFKDNYLIKKIGCY